MIATGRSRTSRMSRMSLHKNRHEMYGGRSQERFERGFVSFELRRVLKMRDRDYSESDESNESYGSKQDAPRNTQGHSQ